MSSANQAPEPTMDEILASIRQIISDDETQAGAATADAVPHPVPNSVIQLTEDQIATETSPQASVAAAVEPVLPVEAVQTPSVEPAFPAEQIVTANQEPAFDPMPAASDPVIPNVPAAVAEAPAQAEFNPAPVVVTPSPAPQVVTEQIVMAPPPAAVSEAVPMPVPEMATAPEPVLSGPEPYEVPVAIPTPAEPEQFSAPEPVPAEIPQPVAMAPAAEPFPIPVAPEPEVPAVLENVVAEAEPAEIDALQPVAPEVEPVSEASEPEPPQAVAAPAENGHIAVEADTVLVEAEPPVLIEPTTDAVIETAANESAAPVSIVETAAITAAVAAATSAAISNEPEIAEDAGAAVPDNGDAGQAISAGASADAGGKSMEDSVKEMLKPMIRQWLNDNMPRILEGAAREELAPEDEGGE